MSDTPMNAADEQYVAGWIAGIRWFQRRFSEIAIEADAPGIARAALVVDAEAAADRALARVGRKRA